MYIATINLDYTATRPTPYQKLLVALEHAGWHYVETSAMLYEADDLDGVRRAFELLARYVHQGGELSALNVQVQAVGPRRQAPSPRNRANAYHEIMREPGPPAP